MPSKPTIATTTMIRLIEAPPSSEPPWTNAAMTTGKQASAITT
jgi:hypothetical protein